MSNVEDTIIDSDFIGKVLLQLILDNSRVRECMNKVATGTGFNQLNVGKVVVKLYEVASQIRDVQEPEQRETEIEDSEKVVDGQDSEKARVDEHGEYIPRPYTRYTGDVVKWTERSGLVTIMGTAINRFLADEKLWTNKNSRTFRQRAKEMIPDWIQADEHFGGGNFRRLVPENDEKHFIKDVICEVAQNTVVPSNLSSES